MEGHFQAAALLTPEGELMLKLPEFAAKVEKLPHPLSEKPYFLIFNKEFYSNNKQVADSLWAAIAVTRESPEFKALFKEKSR